MAGNEVAIPPHIAAQCRPPVSPLSRAASRTGQSIGIVGPGFVVRCGVVGERSGRWRLRRRIVAQDVQRRGVQIRSEEHTSELQSLMRISYAVFCLKKKQKK